MTQVDFDEILKSEDEAEKSLVNQAKTLLPRVVSEKESHYKKMEKLIREDTDTQHSYAPRAPNTALFRNDGIMNTILKREK